MDMQMHPALAGSKETGGLASQKSQNSEISSDFQTFLRMLTAQIQNQNPLEPIEASDFAVQLATFSGVEQQVRTNDLLTQLTTRLGLAELANWVGRDALAPAPQFVDGSPLRLLSPDMQGSDRAELVLRGTDGQEAGRYSVSPGSREIVFEAPLQSEGGPRTGYYTFEIEGFRGGEKVVAAPVLGYSRILEARSDAGQVFLVLEGGHIVDSADVAGLRE